SRKNINPRPNWDGGSLRGATHVDRLAPVHSPDTGRSTPGLLLPGNGGAPGAAYWGPLPFGARLPEPSVACLRAGLPPCPGSLAAAWATTRSDHRRSTIRFGS